MALTHLSTVADNGPEASKSGVVEIGRGGDAAAWRMRQLQFEARALGREQIEALARDLGAVATRAADVASGGDAYPVGARELCARLSEELPCRVQLLLTLARRED